MAHIENIPNELLVQIFKFIQPVFIPFIGEIFQQDFPFKERWMHQSSFALPGHKYHPTISSLRNRPALVRLGQVSRQFRRAVSLHPFWYSLSYHLLAPVPSPKQFALTSILQLSQFIQTISKSYGRLITKKVETLYFSCSSSQMNLLVQDLLTLCCLIKEPMAVKNIVLSLNWLTLCDKEFIEHLCRYKNVEKLYLKGIPEENVITGFDNQSIKLFEKSFYHLTCLFLDGFGGRTFTWKRLQKLLIANPTITELMLNKVRGVVDLMELSTSCPNLSKLTIHLKTEERYLSEEIDVLEALEIRRNMTLGLTFSGDFSSESFPNLLDLQFYEDDTTSWLSTPIIQNLLRSIPSKRFVHNIDVNDTSGFRENKGIKVSLHPFSK